MRVTGTLFDLLGVTAARLTMTPSGRLFWDLASIMQESRRAFLEVLPSMTFTELAGMQMTLRVDRQSTPVQESHPENQGP